MSLLKQSQLDENTLSILQDNEEYLKVHPDEKLTITFQWVDALDLWRLSASIIDSGLEKTESKCMETTLCAPPISISVLKEPSSILVSDRQSFVTRDRSLNQTNTSSTSQQTGKDISKLHGDELVEAIRDHWRNK